MTLPLRITLLTSAVALVLAFGGCVSTGGLLGVGPHKLLRTSEEIADVAANPLPLPRETEKLVLPEYQLEPGDVVLIEPAEFDATIRLPGDQTVQPDGMISLGKYGRLMVAGSTVAEVQSQASTLVNHDRETPVAITARLVEPLGNVYYVLGEVNSPGSFPTIGRETVLDAIVMAGGMADRANRHKVVLSRPSGPNDCRTVLPICYRHIVQLGDSSTNYQIQPGDRIFVASLTLIDEILQTLWPSALETCPQCSNPHVPCPENTGFEVQSANYELQIAN